MGEKGKMDDIEEIPEKVRLFNQLASLASTFSPTFGVERTYHMILFSAFHYIRKKAGKDYVFSLLDWIKEEMEKYEKQED